MFRPVPDFPNYVINRAGQVFSIKSNRFIKEKPGGLKPYPRIILYREGKRYHFWLHRLCCEIWVGPTEGLEVHHKDGNVTNYHSKNLVPLTSEEHIEANKKMRATRLRKESIEIRSQVPF